MIVVEAGLEDVVDINFAAVAAVDLETDDFAGGGFVANGGGNLQLGQEPANF